jgi:hypothetical protein
MKQIKKYAQSIMKLLFAYNNFQSKISAIQKKQKLLLLNSIKKAETNKVSQIQSKIHNLY